MSKENEGVLLIGCWLTDLEDHSEATIAILEEDYDLLYIEENTTKGGWVGLRVPCTVLNLNMSSALALQKLGKEFKKITGVDGRLKSCIYSF